jgi:hypothetical protein
MELRSWVFATAKSCEKIVGPLLSRFVLLEIPKYTFEVFKEIVLSRLARQKVDRVLRLLLLKSSGIDLIQEMLGI